MNWPEHPLWTRGILLLHMINVRLEFVRSTQQPAVEQSEHKHRQSGHGTVRRAARENDAALTAASRRPVQVEPDQELCRKSCI
jgi:hypothetical protein